MQKNKQINKHVCNQQQNEKFMMMRKVGDINHLKVLLTVAHIINPVTFHHLMEPAIVIQDTVIIRVKALIRLVFEEYLKRRLLASLAVDRTKTCLINVFCTFVAFFLTYIDSILFFFVVSQKEYN